MKKRFTIPIFKADLWLVVADDMPTARRKMSKEFGDMPADMDDGAALSSYDGAGRFGLFFDVKYITPEVVAHECFHTTHRILDYVNANFDKEHHETAALLHGYIMGLVMNELYTMKAKLK